MARTIRWQVPFKSLNGTDCRVDIYEEGWTGGITILSTANTSAPGYPTDEPFYYEEDADKDLLKVIRVKTGYLNLVELSYGSLIDLYPETDTQHYIEFYYGLRLDFTGYMQAQAFDNEWVACPRVLSFPIQSPLGNIGIMKFTPHNPVIQQSFMSCLNEVISGLNAAYIGSMLPDGYNEQLASYLTAPYNDNPDKADGSDMYEPMTYEEFLKGVCNIHGLILHDTPNYLIFSRFEYAGDYRYTNDQVFDADNVANIDDSFTIASNKGVDSLVRPLSKIKVNYQGNELMQKSVETNHMVYTGMSYIDLWQGTPTFFGAAVAWLKMFSPEFYSPSMVYTNDLTSGLLPTTKGVIGASIGNKKCVVVYCNGSMGDNSKTILEWRINMYPGFVGTGHLKIQVSVTKHTTINDEGTQADPFNISVEVDGDYYNAVDLDFDSSPHKYGISNQMFWVNCNVPTNCKQMKITLWGSASCADGDLYTIDNMNVELQPEKLYQYKEQYKKERVIELEPQSPDEGSVDMIFSRDKFNTRSLMYAGSSGYTAPTYPYMAIAQNRLQMDFKGTLPDLRNLYLYKWAYWITGWRWRIIALSFYPHDDNYKLTMHRSSTIE